MSSISADSSAPPCPFDVLDSLTEEIYPVSEKECPIKSEFWKGRSVKVWTDFTRIALVSLFYAIFVPLNSFRTLFFCLGIAIGRSLREEREIGIKV